MVRMKKPMAVVLDIEGTITSAKFWNEKLTPFIRNQMEEYMRQDWGRQELMLTLDKLRQKSIEDKQNGHSGPIIVERNERSDVIIATVSAYVNYAMSSRRYNPPLRQFQILVWVFGYEKEMLQGHVFEDVPNAFHEWHKMGIKIFTFSSGLTITQRLIFSCSVYGNLLSLIDDHFDINTGSKQDEESFRKIAERVRIKVSDILFLTDNPSEATAAKKAGCKTLVVSRPDNNPLPNDVDQIATVIDSLEEIKFID